ncbi:hypothetical protein FF38_03573 [Lucilia cuprina]|uniref:protein-tyrosine-phosphatase n=1 Tax=Lucilia cuprina TaxID=7375 RepID=A0A0L0CN12_LUCCU|nr:hypothetical protein FF38_03573 [Lucilia cuprina]
MVYVPPTNFAPVERRLYRSAAPLPINFSFIKLLGIKTVIWLAVEDPSDAFIDFVDENNIQLEHLGLLNEGEKPWDPISDSSIEEALELIMDLNNYPVLICCSMGRHRTGAVVGCLRKLQDWSFASLVDEYQRFTGLKGERANVELLIENFDLTRIRGILNTKFDEQGRLPPWFLQQIST